jgi:hypothetical protein
MSARAIEQVTRREAATPRHWSDVCAGCGQPWTVQVQMPGKVITWCDRCYEEVQAMRS